MDGDQGYAGLNLIGVTQTALFNSDTEPVSELLFINTVTGEEVTLPVSAEQVQHLLIKMGLVPLEEEPPAVAPPVEPERPARRVSVISAVQRGSDEPSQGDRGNAVSTPTQI